MSIDSVILIRFILLVGSSMLIIQGVITLCWMLYAWNNPSKVESKKSPKKYTYPYYSFTALLPVRHEEKVVGDTIRAVNAINYPQNLKEIIVIVRHDDEATIREVQKTIGALGNENISLHILGETFPINKPFSLNMGIGRSNHQVVAIFDAEDEPSPDIYQIVNTVMLKDKVDVVQSGVQLMNYNSHWFSALNVLEYFLWFKSGMHFFADVGKVSLLGGNTVFIKRDFLSAISGWDEEALTEDADLGIRLTLMGAKTKVIYDEKHVTKEETPGTVDGFVKQRTRWNQGFLQILAKGDWNKLPSVAQKFTSIYALTAPFFPLFMLVYIPFGLITSVYFPLPILLAMYTYIPFYILLTIIVVQVTALWEFTRIYNQKFYWYLPIKIALTYVPYATLLSYASLRSVFRFFFGFKVWEKTAHLNLHRVESQ